MDVLVVPNRGYPNSRTFHFLMLSEQVHKKLGRRPSQDN